MRIGDTDIPFSTEVTCLGVVFDQQLTFSGHIRRLSAKCIYHLRQLRVIRRTLTDDAAKTLMHAFITSRIDYCNSVFSRASSKHVRPPQSVLHAAGRLIVRRRKFDSITPIIRNSLHWLLIAQRVEYKLYTFVFKCLHRMAPVYLIEMCIPVSTIQGRSQLRSAAHGELVVPRSTRVTFGNRSFSVSEPKSWNTQPLNARVFTLSFG